ncbi:MAG TPA: TlpA disulfide reductase family protein [Cyclobacteriaceae bacterium]|nr:TlpA disulfide reductase family protein [Cyclobacteriaceae bacterium]
MITRKNVFTVLLLFISCSLVAQDLNKLYAEIREMSKLNDPAKSISSKERIIREYQLDVKKDAETIDMLNGNVALAYAKQAKYKETEQYINFITNPFNQTSILSMIATQLVEQQTDLEYANKLAEEALKRFHAYKDDSLARPENIAIEDWKRFMSFAQYPYYDTYANTLFALKRYEEALLYQRMAFDGLPEEGIPSSVERYAKLLAITGDKSGAKEFLMKVAVKGKLNNVMIAQLKQIYVEEKGSDEGFALYLESLQNSIQSEMLDELSKRMLSESAAAFTLNDIQGNRVSLSDFKGKIVILDLWATWCAPCIASFPAMQQLVNKHKDVVFLFIAVEEKGNNILERVKRFIDRNNYTFQVLLDEPLPDQSDKHIIISGYKPNGIPAKYFIDKSGVLRFKSEGFNTDTELINEIEAKISLLKAL